MDRDKLIKLMFSCYNHITDYYFYVSYITVLILLLVSYQTDNLINHIFMFKLDDFSSSQIVFYLIGNLVMCFVSHWIILRYFKRSPISVIWIFPLVIQVFHIVRALF